MKPTHNILLGLVVASAALLAGSVTIPNTFVANKTAKASEVNANFSAVKTAVDGNAGDIATNKSDTSDNANDIATNKADITTNATNIAGAITDINATNGLAGGGSSGSVTVRRADGNVSITSTTFVPGQDNGCNMSRYSTHTYFHTSSTSDDCTAYAPIFLPDGATLKKLTCRFWNNDGGTATNPSVSLLRAHSSGIGISATLFKVTSGDDAEERQTITDDTIDAASHATVDNGQYEYIIYYNPPDNTDTIGNDQRLYSCTIEYSYQ